MLRSLALSLLALVALACALPALAAADEPRFHRTTPRGSFGRDGEVLLIGVPGGRAWGIESELRPVPRERSALRATVEVRDPDVREAFMRIAWYDRASGRPRQIAFVDAIAARIGTTATLEVPLDPPANAVAYRARVLARMRVRDAVASEAAVRAVLGPVRARGAPLTRLVR